uniref:Uncharacterized protein n=1 Tax=Streptomyces avermitilis TaxID=33903 RepID=A0A499VBV3_STRAX|nr:hypothetical protein SAVMC3_45320 [Streptomyces avermitilis]
MRGRTVVVHRDPYAVAQHGRLHVDGGRGGVEYGVGDELGDEGASGVGETGGVAVRGEEYGDGVAADLGGEGELGW